MKNWFPFTDYDFYAYLTAGMVLVAAVDYSVGGGNLVLRQEWTVVSGVFWGAIAYLVGHIVASPSSALLEHLLARKAFRPPIAIILGLQPPRWHERFVATVLGVREYRPFPRVVSEAIKRKIASSLGVQPNELNDEEAVFQVAFPVARSVSDTATRLDSFINQYGLCRNLSFVSLIATGLLTIRLCQSPSTETRWLLIGAVFLAIGLFVRFLKFYAAYGCEVLRTYNRLTP